MGDIMYYINNGYVRNTEDELMHHGIKGQKWGIRRYQNEDGTLTNLGKKRDKVTERLQKDVDKINKKIYDDNPYEQRYRKWNKNYSKRLKLNEEDDKHYEFFNQLNLDKSLRKRVRQEEKEHRKKYKKDIKEGMKKTKEIEQLTNGESYVRNRVNAARALGLIGSITIGGGLISGGLDNNNSKMAALGAAIAVGSAVVPSLITKASATNSVKKTIKKYDL